MYFLSRIWFELIINPLNASFGQIDNDVKNKLQSLITKHGGEHVTFIPKNVTHLILGEAIGQKYDAARKSNIKIMKEDWVYDSAKCGYPLMEFDYLFEPTNTQPKKFDFSLYDDLLELSQQTDQTRLRSQIASAVDQPSSQINSQISSEIGSQINTQITSQATNRSQIITQLALSTQQSTQTDHLKPLAPEPGKTYCVKSKTELAKSNSTDNTTKRTAFSVLTSSLNANKQKATLNPEDELEKLVNQLNNYKSSTFDGCEFYIFDNFQQNIKTLLKRCITLQNGTTSTSLRQSVSHVIVKDDSTEDERMKLNRELDKFDITIQQVNLKWIIQCSKSNKLIPLIKVPSLSESPTNKEQISLSQQSSQRPVSQQQRRTRFGRHSIHNNQPISQQLPIRELRPSRTDDIFSDYTNLESNIAYNSQVSKCALDLDLMAKEERPLYKCILTFTSYTVTLKDELTKIAQRLGATCQLDFVKTNKSQNNKQKNTHLVLEEAKGDKYHKAIKWNVHVVNQNWLKKCEELVKRVDEKDYPPKQVETDSNAKQSTENRQRQNSGSIVSSASSATSTETADSISNRLSQTVNVPMVTSSNQDQNLSVPGLSQTVQSKLDNLKTILNTDERSALLNKTLVADDNPETNTNANFKIDILNDDRTRFKNNAEMPSIPIAWNDHRTTKQNNNENTSLSLPTILQNQTVNQTTFNQTINQTKSRSNCEQVSMIRSKLIEPEQIESFQVFEDNSTIVEPTPKQQQYACRFQFIGYSPQEKQIFAKQLSKFNINVIMDDSLDYDYVITERNKFLKNECFFISMAKGKWILHPDFYSTTLELGRLPNPEEYEWGSSQKYLQTLDSKYVQLAKACRYWRKKIADTKRFAFTGQTLLVVSVNAKNYSSIIQNGGGKALIAELHIDNRENYASVLGDLYQRLKQGTISNLNYVLINYKKRERDYLNLLHLIRPIEQLGIKCLHIDYLSLFLVSEFNLNFRSVLIDPSSSAPNLKRSLNMSDDSTTSTNKIPRIKS